MENQIGNEVGNLTSGEGRLITMTLVGLIVNMFFTLCLIFAVAKLWERLNALPMFINQIIIDARETLRNDLEILLKETKKAVRSIEEDRIKQQGSTGLSESKEEIEQELKREVLKNTQDYLGPTYQPSSREPKPYDRYVVQTHTRNVPPVEEQKKHLAQVMQRTMQDAQQLVRDEQYRILEEQFKYLNREYVKLEELYEGVKRNNDVANYKVNDYRSIAVFLWQLLDDVDTLTDAVKDNDSAFRQQTARLIKKRFDVGKSDGHNLWFPKLEGVPPSAVQAVQGRHQGLTPQQVSQQPIQSSQKEDIQNDEQQTPSP